MAFVSPERLVEGKEGDEDGEEVEIKASRNLDGIGKHGRSTLVG